MRSYNVFAPFSVVALVLVTILLPWHWKAKNAGVFLLSGWLWLSCLSLSVNSILWWDNVDVKAEAWCEISTRLIYASQIAPVCCSLCVLRRLECIASTRIAHSTPRDRRRQLAWDVGIGIGVPFLFLVMQIINQGHRFDIVEGFGCLPTIYWTPMAIVFNLMPPLVVSFTAMIYGVLALRWFYVRRRQFNAVLRESCAHIDQSRYLRLMAIASIEALVTLPINIGTFADRLQYQRKIFPWISWEDTHFGFSFIGQYPASSFMATADTRRHWRCLELERWGVVVGCIFLFLFFGLTRDSMRAYQDVFRPVSRYSSQVTSLFRPKKKHPSVPTSTVTVEIDWQLDSALQETSLSRKSLCQDKSIASDVKEA